MNGLAILFLLGTASGLLFLPRRWAPLPLLMGACYMTGAQGIDLGVFYFSVLRILVVVGLMRVLLRGERPAGGLNTLDGVLMAWALWAVLSSAFHTPFKDALVNRLGLVYGTCGTYFLLRCFCQSLPDVVGLVKMVAILLVPVALEMLNEQITGRNLFAFLGGVAEEVTVRNDRLRAQGPFAHPILAGTVGAVCAPLMAGIWRSAPRAARVGLAACVLIVLTSGSSGPLMSLIFAGFALLLWRWRHLTRQMRLAAVIGYILLDLVMKAPAYYLLARIDLTGSSTGWHRARLIQSSFEHLDEWWFAGTDYTVHWMPTGVYWSENHTDITNHYLQMGVLGGLPLMLLFIALLWLAFARIGRSLRALPPSAGSDQFLVWSLGASLFAHAATSMSVSYFDQSALFLQLDLALAGSLVAISRVQSSLDASAGPDLSSALPAAAGPAAGPFPAPVPGWAPPR